MASSTDPALCNEVRTVRAFTLEIDARGGTEVHLALDPRVIDLTSLPVVFSGSETGTAAILNPNPLCFRTGCQTCMGKFSSDNPLEVELISDDSKLSRDWVMLALSIKGVRSHSLEELKLGSWKSFDPSTCWFAGCYRCESLKLSAILLVTAGYDWRLKVNDKQWALRATPETVYVRREP